MQGSRRLAIRGVVILAATLFSSLGAASALQADEALSTELASLGSWLDSSPNGAGWKEYLGYDALVAAANQSEADPAIFQDAAARLQAPVPGLENRHFVALREALDRRLGIQGPSPAAAQTAGLVDEIQAAKENFVPIPPDSIEQDRQQVLAVVDRLESELSRTSPAKRRGWESFLNLNAFAETLRSPEPDLTTLQETDAKLYGPQEGLEWESLVELRRSLRDYGSRLYLARLDEGALREQYARQLDRLAEQLKTFDGDADDQALSEIGQIVGWLESAQQAPGVAQRVRQRFGRPNFYVRSNESALSRIGGQPVYDVRPVHEIILGTDIHGTATTVGYASLDLKPNSDGATICVVVEGNTTSNNVGTNRGVVICSIGHSRVHATEPLYFRDGYFTTGPAWANAPTVSTITGVQARGPLIEAIARRRIAQQKSEADAIASQRAAIRARQQIQERVAQAAAEANGRYGSEFVAPLERGGLYPQALSVQTTEHEMFGNAVIAGPTQLGVEATPPAIAVGGDLQVTVHESAIGNVAELLVGGKTITSDQMREQLKGLPAGVALDTEGLDEEDWSVTLPRTRPIGVEFADGRATVVLRGRRFTRGDQEIRRSIDARATYEPVAGSDGVVLRRVGEVEIVFPGGQNLSTSDIAFKVFLQKRLERAFPAEVGADGLTLPGDSPLAGRARIDQFVPQEGWLALGVSVK